MHSLILCLWLNIRNAPLIPKVQNMQESINVYAHSRRTYSVEWAQSIVLPHVEARRQSPDFKKKLLSLKMVEMIIANGACQTDRKSQHQGES